MTPLERLTHLLVMAAADDRMNEAELGFLAARAHEMGISSEQFHEALELAISGEASLSMPQGAAERRSLLKDLVLMMAADGVLAEREKELFAHVATTLEIETEELHRIIDATIAENS